MRKGRDEGARFVIFRGANVETDDDGRLSFSPREDVIINVNQIGAVYDHTIVIMGHKIRVMDSLEEIMQKIGR